MTTPTLADRIAADAWAPDVLDALAQLDPHAADFQRALDAAKKSGVRIRDWRGAIADRRKALDEQRRRAAREAGPDSVPEGDDEASRIAFVRSRLLWGDGEIRKTVANVITILARDPRWEGRLAYHAMRECPTIIKPIDWHEDDAPAKPYTGPWTDEDSVRAASWLSRVWDFDVAAKMVGEAIATVARKIVVDPVRDYLRSVVWDGVQRLPGFLSTYFGAERSEYTAAVGMRWMISAVARAFEPGCKVDCVLVLEGRQGTGKSSAIAALCPTRDLFGEDDLALGNKDAAQTLAGKWIWELGELDKLSRHDLGTLKAFITRQSDTYRPSYGVRARDFPRHTVFAGSVNPGDYLRDEENRRYWPVRAPAASPRLVERDRDQLWAEAVVRFDGGEPWHVDTPELAALCREEQDQRKRVDPWTTKVADWLADRTRRWPCCGDDRCPCVRCAGVTTAEVLAEAIGMALERQGPSEETRAGFILRALSWEKGRQERRAGTRVRPYYPPAPAGKEVSQPG